MKAREIFNHLKEKGTWVNWNATVDKFLFGDPGVEVKGVAVGWMATLPNLKNANELGCNVFVTHEPLYIGTSNEYGVYSANGILLEEDDPWVMKAIWLKEREFSIFRCHDVWDDFPEIGIHRAWARWLGFEGEPIKKVKFYEVHEFKPMKFGDLAKKILDRIRTIGQDCIHIMGEADQLVKSIALGTGAITNYRYMDRLGADVLLLTDDGTRTWESGQWADDTGKPLIIVNHATAEEPGMRSLASYIRECFPDITVRAIERGCLYKSV
ncbi:MAG: Nif3-like dinuclear metal center hexameric protein [Promethearchaeota archaeon]